MDPLFLFLMALLGFMVIGALIAAETEDLLSAVLCVGAVGAGLAIIDLFLGAPDLAITQVVVEVITVTVLIRMVLTRRDETHETHRDTLAVGSVLLGLGVLLALGAWAMTALNPFGQPLLAGANPGAAWDYLMNGLTEVGAANYVTSVLLDYRGYDTIGEATVILAAVIGVYVVLRKSGRAGARAAADSGRAGARATTDSGRVTHASGNEPDC